MGQPEPSCPRPCGLLDTPGPVPSPRMLKGFHSLSEPVATRAAAALSDLSKRAAARLGGIVSCPWVAPSATPLCPQPSLPSPEASAIRPSFRGPLGLPVPPGPLRSAPDLVDQKHHGRCFYVKTDFLRFHALEILSQSVGDGGGLGSSELPQVILRIDQIRSGDL